METQKNENRIDEKNLNLQNETAVIDIPEQTGIVEVKKNKHVPLSKQFLISRVYTTALIGYGVYIATNIAINFILNIIFGPNNDSTSSNQDSLNNDFKNTDSVVLVLLVLYTCFGAPIIEEFIFRSIIFKTINWVGKKVQAKQKFFGILIRGFAFIFSSFIFAFAHYNFSFSLLIKEIRTFPPYFTMGLIFAWAYNRDGYYLASVATHSLNNIIATALSFLLIYFAPQTLDQSVIIIDLFKLNIIKLFSII